MKKLSTLMPATSDAAPDKVTTWSGKHTARVSKSYSQPDGSVVIATQRINKDGSISRKIEHRSYT